MSGPKVSEYELKRRRQEELRRQYLEEQKRIEAHRRQQEGFRDNIRYNISKIRNLKAGSLTIVNEISCDENCRFDEKEFQKLCAEADDLIRRSMAVHDRGEISPQVASECNKEAGQIIGRLLQKHQEALDERMVLGSSNFLSSLQAIRDIADTSICKDPKSMKAESEEYERRALEVYHIGCSALADAQADMPDKAEKIRQLQNRLDFEVKELGGSAQEIFQAALDCQHEIEHQVNVWRKEEKRNQEARAKHAELVHRYHYYCNELGLERMSVEELNAQSERMLESLCATLDNMLYRQYEENYIFKCINEAMADIGYDLYGRASNGIRGQFLYRMHGDTVIHVACSDQGIISMEVGRAANMQRELDANEVDELVQDMHTFCGDYAALQKKLADMGVKCRNNIELNPPHPDFAMLLDTSEYELCQSTVSEAAQRSVQYLDLGE